MKEPCSWTNFFNEKFGKMNKTLYLCYCYLLFTLKNNYPSPIETHLLRIKFLRNEKFNRAV